MSLAARSRTFGAALLLLAACSGEAPESSSASASMTPGAPSLEQAPAVEPAAPDPRPAGILCPDPDAPCPGFRPNDLSFVLPADGVARAEVRSDSFHAVILRSAPRCAITDAERQEAQTRFHGRKVFAQRFQCEDDIANNVAYTAVNDTVAFMGVYAGADRAEADSVLRSVREMGGYPGANLRRMQVVFVYP